MTEWIENFQRIVIHNNNDFFPIQYPAKSCISETITGHSRIFLAWRHHQMETFSALRALYKGQWREALIYFFISALDKRMSKQSWGWWFETPSRPLWRQRLVLQQDVITFLGSLLIEMKHFLQKMLIYFDIEVVGNEALVNTDQMMPPLSISEVISQAG